MAEPTPVIKKGDWVWYKNNSEVWIKAIVTSIAGDHCKLETFSNSAFSNSVWRPLHDIFHERPGSEPRCIHTYKKYVGLTVVDYYCTKCGHIMEKEEYEQIIGPVDTYQDL